MVAAVFHVCLFFCYIDRGFVVFVDVQICSAFSLFIVCL